MSKTYVEPIEIRNKPGIGRKKDKVWRTSSIVNSKSLYENWQLKVDQRTKKGNYNQHTKNSTHLLLTANNTLEKTIENIKQT